MKLTNETQNSFDKTHFGDPCVPLQRIALLGFRKLEVHLQKFDIVLHIAGLCIVFFYYPFFDSLPIHQIQFAQPSLSELEKRWSQQKDY